MINERCPGCGSNDSAVVYDLSQPAAHQDVGLAGIVNRCRSCSLLFKTFDRNLDSVYDDNYASMFVENEEYSSDHAMEFFSKILHRPLEAVQRGSVRPELLDLGSGIGVMLDAATKMGYIVTGVELSPRLAAIARQKGHEVINQNISRSSLDRKFDTITMMDIIEHLDDPKAVLESLKPLLKSHGQLIVYTPNHDSLIVKIAHLLYRLGMKLPAENIFACTHTCFFTTGTLKDTLTRSGYKIIAVDHFNYDTARPGQKISTTDKIFINTIETIGSFLGFRGFRVVMYVTL